ncbi:hypothetical protein JMUB7522_27330 [Staphylococcus aureus]
MYKRQGKISLQMHAFPKEIRKIVFNEEYDEDGVYEEKQGKQNNYVAVWFRQERSFLMIRRPPRSTP